MIAIRFSPIYEDRVSIFLKQSRLKNLGIEYKYEDSPFVFGHEERLCYWIIEPKHNSQINLVFSELIEMKSTMGIENIEFQYADSMKEYFTQANRNSCSLHWFKV